MENNNVLTIEDLRVSFDTYAGEVQAVRGVSYAVNEGEVLAVVGESGCGKSVTAQTIMKLNPMPPARIKSGSIMLNGRDIVPLSEKEMLIELKTFVEHLTCDCTFITHHTISGKNLTGPDFLKRKDAIVAALDHEIRHGDMDMLAAIRRNKRTL